MRIKSMMAQRGLPGVAAVCIMLSVYGAWRALSRLHMLNIEGVFYGAALAALVFLAGYCVGQMVLRKKFGPIRQVAEIAESITHEDLSRRVTVESAGDDVQYLVKAFNDMISRLEAAFAYITESSSYIAHELKTPLAIIRGEAEVVLKKERDREEYKKVILGSLEETRRMFKIIEDLLLLTRVNYRSGDMVLAPLDLKAFVMVLYEKAKILALEKDITVMIQVPEATALVNGDEQMLRRLFLNLVDNAVKFTPRGGAIDIYVALEEGHVKISVADTGVGIEAENLPRLFDKFFRIEGKIKETSPSSGLGLSIAQSIARLHQGEITVSSQAGKGSVFMVVLPRSTQSGSSH